MKKVFHLSSPSARAKRLNVSEAKAKLSQALRDVGDRPTIIHNRGRDVAVLMSIEDYERFIGAEEANQLPTMKTFIDSVQALKQRFGGGAALPVVPARLVPRDPFGRGTR
jgi:prevent-host-death family protein